MSEINFCSEKNDKIVTRIMTLVMASCDKIVSYYFFKRERIVYVSYTNRKGLKNDSYRREIGSLKSVSFPIRDAWDWFANSNVTVDGPLAIGILRHRFVDDRYSSFQHYLDVVELFVE